MAARANSESFGIAPSRTDTNESGFSRWTSSNLIATVALIAIILHLFLRYLLHAPTIVWQAPLIVILIFGGVPLIVSLARKLFAREFGSDHLAGISIVTSVILGEYLVGAIVILMLSGGAALEHFATRRASSVLSALAKRMPQTAHRKIEDSLSNIQVSDIRIGDALVMFPHEICPVDGVVVEGHGKMNEAYLTGEPYEIEKVPGTAVLSGSVNGESPLTIVAERLPADSRYAKIMRVMQDAEQRRPRLRRLGDTLGAWYTPVALALACIAWAITHDSQRFLAVLVIATPCPLLIAIPVAVIGAISLAARRSIIIKNPAVLEQIDRCKTLIFDKTGTLTYGEPSVTEVIPASGFEKNVLLTLAASLERYSKHPLSKAILDAADGAGIALKPAIEIREHPGEGLRGRIDGQEVWIAGRRNMPPNTSMLPAPDSGLECLIIVNGAYAGVFHFRDAPRKESLPFIAHLMPHHQVSRVLIVSGDQSPEAERLGAQLGIREVYAAKSPEEKVNIVRAETKRAPTLFLGDGINDAPAMQAATVGVAFGIKSEITSEAADAVVLETSLSRVDELMHIARRMRRVALQSAIGGMALSVAGMFAAALGYLPPIGGAIAQEVIDLAAVLNAVRVAVAPRILSDYNEVQSKP